MVTLYTIGFTKKNAELFFETLKRNNINLLLDIRLNNVSQLAGYTKKDDLKYFLKEICNIQYLHMPELSPTKEILDNFKKNIISWTDYEEKFLNLYQTRPIEKLLKNISLDHACLLCSEVTPEKCHRRLVAEQFLQSKFIDRIVHL